MNKSTQILSDITVFMKYAKYIPELQRRETWTELVDRNKAMHIKKYPQLAEDIEEAYKYVYDKKILPSMRSMQFAGKPVEINPARIYNCAYLPIDDWRAFGEAMFLLLGGTGVGYSVQKHHIEKLSEIRLPNANRKKRYLVNDSIEGWADAVKMLVKSYFTGGPTVNFDFSDIRPKGARLVTSGGKAPGPQPLKECLIKLDGILSQKQNGDKLSPIEVHDMVCHIADAVLAGGIRRAALISLFSADDDEMIACKSGNWWETNAQRGRANNSAVLLRHKITEQFFFDLWKRIELSGAGEPGICLTNDKDWGTNPSLRRGTKVLTTDGVYPIEELEGKTFNVKNLNGEISEAKCWLSGKGKKLYKLTLSGGHEYYATAEHEWPVWDGEKYVKVKTPDVQGGALMPILRESSLFNGSVGTYDDGFMMGWLIGDGWSNEYTTDVTARHSFIVSDKDKLDGVADILERTVRPYTNSQFHQDYKNENIEDDEFMVVQKVKQSTSTMQITNKQFSQVISDFGYKNKQSGLPSISWKDGSEEFRRGLIDGLFSSDGHVEKDKKRIVLCTKHEKLATDVSELLGFYGIKTNIRAAVSKLNGKDYPQWKLNIEEGGSIKHFRSLFKLTSKHKQAALDSYNFPYNIENNNIQVVGVEETDLHEDVWDISVYDETHCFQIAHVVTGNCCEIALRPFQFCNLCEVNVSDIESQEDLNQRVRAASLIGTLQAGYTDFHYLRDIWRRTTEKDALIGVSMTGIGSGTVLGYDMKEAAGVVKEENERVAQIIGINKSARTTTVKPAGTSSLTLGTSSGIHAWHNDYYVRRIRVGKNEAIYSYLLENHPQLVEDEYFRPHDTAVISVPQKAPEGAILRTESAIELLERVKKVHKEWIKPGHRSGQNTHNVSATVSIKPEEWEEVGWWAWGNRKSYNGLSVLNYDGGSYTQAPFEDITEEQYEEMAAHLDNIDLSKVVELEDNTELKEQAACAGGVCEIR